MADIEVKIGALRWRVILARRRLNFDPPGGTGIYEDYTAVETVAASVMAVGSLTFQNGQQTDTPITHRIVMRWVDYLDNTNIVIRDTLRRDGTLRREIFRVRRVAELNGRKRFSALDCELERSDDTRPGSGVSAIQAANQA